MVPGRKKVELGKTQKISVSDIFGHVDTNVEVNENYLGDF